MSERRDFFGKTLGAFAGLGALGALYAAKRTWDPLPSVKAGGFTTVDLSAAKENVLVTEMWRGKPIFILKVAKSDKKAHENKRLIDVNGDKFLVAVGLCTHLGCIPAYFGEEHSFKCACHGGEFDAAGEVTKAPPPSPLVIPPFKLDGTKMVLGEEGPEFQKLKADGLIA